MDQFLNSKLIQCPLKTTRPNTPGRIGTIALTLMKYQPEVIEYIWENYEADDLPSWVGRLAEDTTTDDEGGTTTMEEDITTEEEDTPEEQEEVDATVQELLRPAQSHTVEMYAKWCRVPVPKVPVRVAVRVPVRVAVRVMLRQVGMESPA